MVCPIKWNLTLIQTHKQSDKKIGKRKQTKNNNKTEFVFFLSFDNHQKKLVSIEIWFALKFDSSRTQKYKNDKEQMQENSECFDLYSLFRNSCLRLHDDEVEKSSYDSVLLFDVHLWLLMLKSFLLSNSFWFRSRGEA